MSIRTLLTSRFLVDVGALIIAAVLGAYYVWRRRRRGSAEGLDSSASTVLERSGDATVLGISGTLLVCAAAGSLTHAEIITTGWAFVIGVIGWLIVLAAAMFVERDHLDPSSSRRRQ